MTFHFPFVRFVFAVFAIVDYASDRRDTAVAAVGVLVLVTALAHFYRQAETTAARKLEARA